MKRRQHPCPCRAELIYKPTLKHSLALRRPFQPLKIVQCGSRISRGSGVPSTVRRYATTNRGDLYLPTDLKWISLTNLRSVIANVAATLDGLDMGLGVYLDQKAQCRSYLASEGRSSS